MFGKNHNKEIEDFRKKVLIFEEDYKNKLLEKMMKEEKELSREEWINLNEKVNKAIERNFNKESEQLILNKSKTYKKECPYQ